MLHRTTIKNWQKLSKIRKIPFARVMEVPPNQSGSPSKLALIHSRVPSAIKLIPREKHKIPRLQARMRRMKMSMEFRIELGPLSKRTSSSCDCCGVIELQLKRMIHQ